MRHKPEIPACDDRSCVFHKRTRNDMVLSILLELTGRAAGKLLS